MKKSKRIKLYKQMLKDCKKAENLFNEGMKKAIAQVIEEQELQERRGQPTRLRAVDKTEPSETNSKNQSDATRRG